MMGDIGNFGIKEQQKERTMHIPLYTTWIGCMVSCCRLIIKSSQFNLINNVGYT